MSTWGAYRVQCAIPDCPEGDRIFSSQRKGEIHLWLEHNISSKGYRDFLVYLETVPRRTKETEFEEWWAKHPYGEGQAVDANIVIWEDVGDGRRDGRHVDLEPEMRRAYEAGWKARILRRPPG